MLISPTVLCLCLFQTEITVAKRPLLVNQWWHILCVRKELIWGHVCFWLSVKLLKWMNTDTSWKDYICVDLHNRCIHMTTGLLKAIHDLRHKETFKPTGKKTKLIKSIYSLRTLWMFDIKHKSLKLFLASWFNSLSPCSGWGLRWIAG